MVDTSSDLLGPFPDFLASGLRMIPSDCRSLPLKSVINCSTLALSSYKSCGLAHEYVKVSKTFKVVLACSSCFSDFQSVCEVGKQILNLVNVLLSYKYVNMWLHLRYRVDKYFSHKLVIKQD